MNNDPVHNLGYFKPSKTFLFAFYNIVDFNLRFPKTKTKKRRSYVIVFHLCKYCVDIFLTWSVCFPWM